jgi:hypothetical protein
MAARRLVGGAGAWPTPAACASVLGDRRRHVADGRDFTVCSNTQTCGEGRTFKADGGGRESVRTQISCKSQSAELVPPRRRGLRKCGWRLHRGKAVACHRLGLVILCVGCPQKAERPKAQTTGSTIFQMIKPISSIYIYIHHCFAWAHGDQLWPRIRVATLPAGLGGRVCTACVHLFHPPLPIPPVLPLPPTA